MERRGFMNVSAVGASGFMVFGGEVWATAQASPGAGAQTTAVPDMDQYLARMDSGLDSIASWSPSSTCPDFAGDRQGVDELGRKALKTLYVTAMFADLPESAQRHPGVQERVLKALPEMDETTSSVADYLGSRTPEQLERAQRALRDSQNPAMQMLESLDEQAALAGVSTGRRLQTRRIMSEAVWRLRNQPPALVIRETLGKVDKVSASDVSLEARRDLVASRAGEKLFWDQQQRQTGVGPGGPAADSTSTAERHDRGNLAGRGAKTMGIGILVGGVAAAGAAAGAFPLVFVVTAGALMFLIGLIMLLIGIGTDSTPQTSER